MAKQHVMDRSGHTTFEFDPNKSQEVAEAMERFTALVKDGHTPATRKGEGDYRVNRTFDPNADETVFVSPMQGG
jgi:hypothetical protein